MSDEPPIDFREQKLKKLLIAATQLKMEQRTLLSQLMLAITDEQLDEIYPIIKPLINKWSSEIP